MNLIELAQRHELGRISHNEVTPEEMELFIAYMEGVVTAHQAKAALERSHGYFINWCRRCFFQLYNQQKITIENNHRQIRFQPKSYDERRKQYLAMAKRVVKQS